MKISKFIGKNFTDKPFHSNGYAQAAQGERIGSVSQETFNQRQAMQKNRKLIGHYKDARITQNHSYDYHTLRQPSYKAHVNGATEHIAKAQAESINPTGNRQSQAPATKRSAFNEPSSRKYDPFK